MVNDRDLLQSHLQFNVQVVATFLYLNMEQNISWKS